MSLKKLPGCPCTSENFAFSKKNSTSFSSSNMSLKSQANDALVDEDYDLALDLFDQV